MKTRKSETSITQTLTTAFGITFSQASQNQKLALIECTAFLMRETDYYLKEALCILTPEVPMPPELSSCNLTLKDFREGLTLLALLYGGVTRDYGGISED